MSIQSSMHSATNMLVPADRSRNPVEKLAYELLCREYRSRYPRLSGSEKTEFRRVLQRIVVTRSMTSVSRHSFADHLGVIRLPTVAEFELLAILYGVRGCARCHWFAAYAAEHPDALEPRFRGIIVQIDKAALPRVLRNRQRLPDMAMDKVPLDGGPAMRRGSDPERSSTESAPSRQSSAPSSSASSASVPAVPAPAAGDGSHV
ncbi:hypothetical protein E4U42_000188, partial [Claviceps africana]